MVNITVFVSIAIVLASISQINCGDDSYAALSKRAAAAHEKISRAISGKLNAKNARVIQQEITHFKDNVKAVEGLMATGASKLDGDAHKLCLKAKETFDKAVKIIEEAVNKASKNTRAESEHGVMDHFIKGVKGGISLAGQGMKDFLQAVRPIGSKGLSIAAGVAHAYEKAAESIAISMAEVSSGKDEAEESPATSEPEVPSD